VPATRDVAAEIQAFNETNAGYWLQTHGYPPPPDDAAQAFDVHPPPDVSYTDDPWLLLRDRATHAIVAQIAFVTDWVAPHVWHFGFFIVATRLHGTGYAGRLHAAWRTWAHRSGARWLRLNVVEANGRALAFWRRQGYVEVRRRDEFVLGRMTHVLITMAQALRPATLDEYLQAVPRDRPGGAAA
jgi:GNAT superfamily N-acetyltransferase